MFRNNWKMIGDVILNLIAAAIPIVILQFVVYPSIATQIDADEYGLMIAIYSLLCMVSFSLGNAINNTRLVKWEMYEAKMIIGDYNIIVMIFGTINILLVGIGVVYYYGNPNLLSIVLVVTASICFFLVEYLEVTFRIELNYKKILINKVCLTIGYLAGLCIFYKTFQWEWVFLLGQAGSLVYILINSKLLKESFKQTFFFKSTFRDVVLLLSASLLGNLMSYSDKLILYPLLGGKMVTIYYIATLVGKTISMAIAPITSVMLSYLSHMKNIKIKKMAIIFVIGAVISVVGYFLCLFITKPILLFIYPEWGNEAMVYVPITTLAVIISAFSSIINPFALKFCSMYWQTIISVISVICYFGCSLLLLHYFGLIGFCWGTVIGSLVRGVLLLFITVKPMLRRKYDA